MTYFVTGATGFIGRFLIAELLKREGTIYACAGRRSLEKLDDLRDRLGDDDDRIVPIVGDLSKERLGVSTPRTIEQLNGKVEHFFHLAAIYDLTADADSQRVANVEGTRHALQLAEAVHAEHFHQVSSIAAAGLYQGVFTEDMFDEATDVDNNPYYATKHESERVVREESQVPWRVYRPGIVVGSSETGEIDKIDGPYYFFRAIQRLRDFTPSWLRGVGIEGGPINIVPVDYVAKAMDYLAHQPGLDGRAFHLTDPEPMTVGQMTNAFAKAAKAPQFAYNLDTSRSSRRSQRCRSRSALSLSRLPGAKQVGDLLLAELGIPREVLHYVNYPTKFDSTKTQEVLAGSDIEVPPLANYAQTLWEYWERTYSPDRRKDRALARAIKGKTVMITGASSGIGRATALRVGAAGGKVILVARGADKLEQTRARDRGPRRHRLRAPLRPVRHERHRAHGQGSAAGARPGRRSREQRRPLDPPFDRAVVRPVPRLRAHDAAELLRRRPPRPHAVADDAPDRTGRPQGRSHHQHQLDRRPDEHAAVLGLRRVQGGARRVLALHRVRGASHDGVHLTTIHMPLVRTPMIAPTTMYDRFPTMTPTEAADLICKAMIRKPKKVGTPLGNAGALAYQLAPRGVDVVMNYGYKIFPDSKAAKGAGRGEEPTSESVAFAHILRGVHW